MAARKKLRHDAETRKKIQASQLINRLQNDAMGKIELTDGQRASIKILLDKSLPSLKAIEGQMEHVGEVTFRWKGGD